MACTYVNRHLKNFSRGLFHTRTLTHPLSHLRGNFSKMLRFAFIENGNHRKVYGKYKFHHVFLFTFAR